MIPSNAGGQTPKHGVPIPKTRMPQPPGVVQQSGLSANAANRSSNNPPPKKQRRRLADKVIPPEIGELVPEYHAYMNFLSFERSFDVFITRKRLELQECLKRPMKVKRKLRIFVSHTFYPGKGSEKGTEDAQVPQWELRVEGKLIDDDQTKNQTQSLPPNQMPPQMAPKRKFSSFFKSLVIELDKDIYGPDNHLVEWHRTPTTNETDGFQVKRPGDRHVRCTILLLLDHTPMKFKLDARLARLLGVHTETRPKIIESLWEYIKEHKLQDAHERDHINCDKYLEQTFQCQRMRFMEIPQRLNALLLPPDPIVINHIITCNPDGTEPKRTACYDIDVEIDDPLKNKINQFLTSIQNLNDIATCDNKINEIVEQIQQVKLQREFYLSFAQDPITFIEKWVISQSRDLQIMTDANGSNEEERKSEFYSNAWISEAIGRYFYNKVQQKRAELEQALGIKNV